MFDGFRSTYYSVLVNFVTVATLISLQSNTKAENQQVANCQNLASSSSDSYNITMKWIHLNMWVADSLHVAFRKNSSEGVWRLNVNIA